MGKSDNTKRAQEKRNCLFAAPYVAELVQRIDVHSLYHIVKYGECQFV